MKLSDFFLTDSCQKNSGRTVFFFQIVNHQPNPGVKYEYSLPLERQQPQIAPPYIQRQNISFEPRRLDSSPNLPNHQKDEPKVPIRKFRLRRKFSWKVSGTTPCTKTCGGGKLTLQLATPIDLIF